MTEQITNRRESDKNMEVLATKIEGLGQDITENSKAAGCARRPPRGCQTTLPAPSPA